MYKSKHFHVKHLLNWKIYTELQLLLINTVVTAKLYVLQSEIPETTIDIINAYHFAAGAHEYTRDTMWFAINLLKTISSHKLHHTYRYFVDKKAERNR